MKGLITLLVFLFLAVPAYAREEIQGEFNNDSTHRIWVEGEKLEGGIYYDGDKDKLGLGGIFRQGKFDFGVRYYFGEEFSFNAGFRDKNLRVRLEDLGVSWARVYVRYGGGGSKGGLFVSLFHYLNTGENVVGVGFILRY